MYSLKLPRDSDAALAFLARLSWRIVWKSSSRSREYSLMYPTSLSVVRRPADKTVSDDSNFVVGPRAATTLGDESLGIMSLRVVPLTAVLNTIRGRAWNRVVKKIAS